MSTPFGQYGGFKYENPTTRALGSITVESYEKVYDDQAQFMSKLAGDVSFLAGMSRKQQAGIDQANENFIQQLQDMINDVIVLIGGGGDTGFDFGDLRYVFIAIGALFGFTDSNGKIQIPLNLFQAAWHFFSNYILPVDNFQQAINEIVDTFIATMLDVLGEIPIVGQAAEQLAAIISDIRDILLPLFNAIQAFFSAFSIDISDTGGIAGLFGPFAPIVRAIMQALDGVVLPDFAAVFHIIALWTEPFVQDIADAIEWVAEIIHTIINIPFGGATLGDLMKELALVLGPIMNLITLVVDALAGILSPLQMVARLFGGGSVPAGAVTNATPDLLVDSLFSADSISASTDWFVDLTSSRTSDGTGSAMVVADGRKHALRSGANPDDMTVVGSGQTLTASVFVINEGYVGTGASAAVELQIAPYTVDGLQNFVTIATYTPNDDILDWTNAVELTGTYEVPANIIGVQVRLYLSDEVLQGTFRFDDGTLTHATTMAQTNVSGLAGILQFIVNQFQALLDTIISVLTGIPIIGGIIRDVENALKSIASGNILGIFGGSTIGEDIQSILDHLISAFTGKASSGGSVADLHSAIITYTNIANTDETHYYTAASTLAIPSWANYIDVIPLGPGQGGEQGEILGFNGQGGAPGKFNPTMWVKGTHYDAGTGAIVITPGTAGAKNGGVGTATTVAIPAGTTATAHSISAAAGNITEAVSWFGSVVGAGPLGNVDALPNVLNFNAQNYAGGINQTQHSAAGVVPGGAGAGGNGDIFSPGGPGAGGAVWIRFRANAITGQSTGADQTPPSLPTPTVVSSTNNSITFSFTGSVDS